MFKGSDKKYGIRCEICEKIFKSKKNVKRHFATVHDRKDRIT